MSTLYQGDSLSPCYPVSREKKGESLMNAKSPYRWILTCLLACTLLIQACSVASKATSAPVAEEPKQNIIKTVVVEKEVQVIEASPLPTSALIAEQPISQATAVPEIYEPGAVPTPADNYFEDYGVNPYTDAYEDHLSTFALDVDTASYTVMRRYLQDGNLPPADSVRVEEYINYFDQEYPIPENAAFAIFADGAPSPFEEDVHLLRIGIQGYEIPEWDRKPSALTFVIDVSGSMQREDRLELVKDALELLVEQLDEEDSVAIVVYGSTARTVLDPTSGDQKHTIMKAINALKPEGSTNAEAGLRQGFKLAMQAYEPGMNNRVILCSDGVANVGATGPEDIMQTIRGYVDEGIYLTTVGFGMGNFNDVLMEQLADTGNGSYAYVDTLDEAERIFVDNLTSTLETIALDAKVQVDFNPDVVSYYRLIGYENRDVADQDFRNNSVDAGELGAGHSATALYAVMLQPGAEGRIATVQLRWQDPNTYEVAEINGNFNSWDLSDGFEDTSPRYQLTVLVAQYAEILRGSPWTDSSSLKDIYRLARSLRSSLKYDPDVVEFVDLVNQASQVRALGQ
jgi:Ca-activated chloride channel family protein